MNTRLEAQKNTESSLRESEEQFRLLFETMASGFSLLEMIYDDYGKPVDCRYVTVNPAHSLQSGLIPSEIIGKTAKKLFGLKDEWIEKYGEVDKTGEVLTVEDYAEGLGEGTGMGLSVVHGIVGSYRVAITADSEPGQGTIFKVYLPIIEMGKE